MGAPSQGAPFPYPNRSPQFPFRAVHSISSDQTLRAQAPALAGIAIIFLATLKAMPSR
jgi:hypothetical protein